MSYETQPFLDCDTAKEYDVVRQEIITYYFREDGVLVRNTKHRDYCKGENVIDGVSNMPIVNRRTYGCL